jgi:molybdate transport system substrate-binding protein
VPAPRRTPIPAAAAAAALLLIACGGEAEGERAAGSPPAPRPMSVSAAASLTEAFTACGRELAGEGLRPRFSFAGSDELAAQIERGVTPDVYAAADAELPRRLFDAGKVEEPVPFASNRLVAIVPAGSSAVRRLEDAARDGVTVVVGDPEVPIGLYTRTVLESLDGAEGLPEDFSRRVLRNVRSNEPDVKGVVGKVRQGAADVGFVYVTDARPVASDVRVLDVPAAAQPRVTYEIAVVKGAENPHGARAFVESAVSGACQAALRARGFEPVPR